VLKVRFRVRVLKGYIQTQKKPVLNPVFCVLSRFDRAGRYFVPLVGAGALPAFIAAANFSLAAAVAAAISAKVLNSSIIDLYYLLVYRAGANCIIIAMPSGL